MRTAESVTLTCCPPAPDDRYVSIRRSLGSISGSSESLERGNRVERRERGLASRVGVERRDANEAVDALLALEQAERVTTLHDEGRGRDARFRPLLDLVELDVEAAPFRPARVHAQQHLGPVLRVGAARTGVHLADRVTLVVLAREQRAQLELVEIGAQRHDTGVDLGLDRIVALLAAELEQRLDLGEALLERRRRPRGRHVPERARS